MSWLESIKNAVLIDDPAAPAKVPPAQVNNQTAGANGGTISTLPQAVGVNEEFLAAIKKVVMARNSALTQLLAAADKLASIIPDPTTRFKAAAATSADGRTVPQILAAVDIHLQDVDGEEARFRAAVTAKANTEVGGLERAAETARTRMATAQHEIEVAQRRIQELSNIIAAANTEFADAQNGAAAKRAEIEQLQMQFAAAANAVRQELTAHKSTIQSALS